MTACSPSPREVERLLGILDGYARDELWLRVNHCFHLPEQPEQVCFEVVDADGVELRDRSGRVRAHTLQVYSSAATFVPGQLAHLCRDGEGVRVEILALVPEVHRTGWFGETAKDW